MNLNLDSEEDQDYYLRNRNSLPSNGHAERIREKPTNSPFLNKVTNSEIMNKFVTNDIDYNNESVFRNKTLHSLSSLNSLNKFKLRNNAIGAAINGKPI